MSFGLRLTSNGWGAFLDKGWVKNKGEKESDLFYDTRNVQLEFDEVKHAKEGKHTNTYISQVTNDKPKPFIYGKINNFYTVKQASQSMALCLCIGSVWAACPWVF